MGFPRNDAAPAQSARSIQRWRRNERDRIRAKGLATVFVLGFGLQTPAWAQTSDPEPNAQTPSNAQPAGSPSQAPGNPDPYGREVPASQAQIDWLSGGVQESLKQLDPDHTDWAPEALAPEINGLIQRWADAHLLAEPAPDPAQPVEENAPFGNRAPATWLSDQPWGSAAPRAQAAGPGWQQFEQGEPVRGTLWQAGQALRERVGGPWDRLSFHIEAIPVATQWDLQALIRVHGARQTHAGTWSIQTTFTMSWSRNVPLSEVTGAAWEPVGWDEVKHDRVLVPSGAQAPFVDRSRAVIPKALFEQQFEPGLPAWRERLDAELGLGLLGHQGLAIADVNGDGLEDVYLCEPGGLPNRLLLHQPDGSTLDVSKEYGVDLLDYTSAALWLDLDGDGDRDLALTTSAGVVVLENRPGQAFLPKFEFPGGDCTSLAAEDIDGDGDIDLYVCRYASPYESDGLPFPYHDADNGAPNWLLLNQGDFAFEEASQRFGLDVGAHRFSFSAAFEDYDNDGDADLYVANDFGRNSLYQRTEQGFVEVASEAGAVDLAAGMGVTWGDWNRDGWMDLYVSNMDSNAGQRLTRMPAFLPDSDRDQRQTYWGHARGSSTFLGGPNGQFTDTTLRSGGRHSLWAWGGLALDMDLDGNQDLVVPNGFVTGVGQRDL